MATLIETVERDGHEIAIYESGAEYDMTDKKLIKGPTGSQITAQNATVYIRKRQEKAARLLRERIIEAHNKKMEPVRSSAAAFGDSGALLYEEIVLNKEAYPRDRLETWEKLGKYSGVLPSDLRGQQEGPSPGDTVSALAAGAAAAVLKFLNDVTSQQRQPADVIDIRSENSEEDG